MNNNLIPEARVDKNGHTVIRHVRPDQNDPTSQRSLPVPTISAIPIVAEKELLDYDAAIQRNIEFFQSTEPVTLSVEDLAVYSDLLDRAAKKDDDGHDRVWYTGQLIKYGNTGAIKTILAHIEEHEASDDFHSHVFNAWSYGCEAGVFEQGKDYSADPKDSKYFSFVTNVFAASEYDHPVREASIEEIRQVASIYHELDGNVDADELAEYWEERGDLDGFIEYSHDHNATRAGKL